MRSWAWPRCRSRRSSRCRGNCRRCGWGPRRSRGWSDGRCRCRCNCGCSRRRWSWGWCSRRCRCRCGSLSARKYPDIVYIFFVLVSLRVEVKRGRVRYVTAGFVGNDGDIVAYLALIWIPFERIKRIAHCHVRRPGNTSIGAPGIE